MECLEEQSGKEAIYFVSCGWIPLAIAVSVSWPCSYVSVCLCVCVLHNSINNVSGEKKFEKVTFTSGLKILR